MSRTYLLIKQKSTYSYYFFYWRKYYKKPQNLTPLAILDNWLELVVRFCVFFWRFCHDFFCFCFSLCLSLSYFQFCENCALVQSLLICSLSQRLVPVLEPLSSHFLISSKLLTTLNIKHALLNLTRRRWRSRRDQTWVRKPVGTKQMRQDRPLSVNVLYFKSTGNKKQWMEIAKLGVHSVKIIWLLNRLVNNSFISREMVL